MFLISIIILIHYFVELVLSLICRKIRTRKNMCSRFINYKIYNIDATLRRRLRKLYVTDRVATVFTRSSF